MGAAPMEYKGIKTSLLCGKKTQLKKIKFQNPQMKKWKNRKYKKKKHKWKKVKTTKEERKK